MSITERVANTQDNYRVFGLIAGNAGVGKTTQLTTFPKDSVLGISVEDGFLSIAGSGYSYLEITSYQDLIEVITKKIGGPKYKNIKYLFIDSLSEIYALLKRELAQNYTAKQNFQKHEEMQDIMFYILRLSRQLSPLNVYFTCHTKEEKNGLVIEDNLSFDGKMPEDIKKQFDFIVHMKDYVDPETREVSKWFITSSSISKVAKKRVSPWLGIQINDFEHPDIYQLTLKLQGKKQ